MGQAINRIPYPFDRSSNEMAGLVKVTHHWSRALGDSSATGSWQADC